MSTMIQIRNVPDKLHRKLKIKAARQGITLSDLLLREAERLAVQPTLDELVQRIQRRTSAKKSGIDVVGMIHADRAERG